MAKEDQNMILGAFAPDLSDAPEIRVYVIDEELLIGESIASFLSGDPRLKAAAFKRLALAELGDLPTDHGHPAPEVVLLRTVASRGRFGWRQLQQLILACHGRPVVVFEDVLGTISFEDAIEAGAAGIVPHQIEPRRLANILVLVANGDRYVPRDYVRAKVPRFS